MVQCPLCQAAFEAPPVEDTQAAEPAPLVAPSQPQSRPRLERPRVLHEEPVLDVLPARQRAALRRAAQLMWVSVMCHMITTFSCCLLTVSGGLREDLLAFIPLSLLCKYLPVFVGAMAASRMQERRNRGLCLAGGVLVLVASLWALMEAGVSGLASVRGMPGFVSNLGAVVALVAFATGLSGGARTLAILTDPRVKAAFR